MKKKSHIPCTKCGKVPSKALGLCENHYHSMKQIQYAYKPGYRFSNSKKNAERRGLKWDISREDFIQLTSLPCTYCGEVYESTGSSLDRINPQNDYTISNVVPACKGCNVLRGTNLTMEETKDIVAYLKKTRMVSRIWKF